MRKRKFLFLTSLVDRDQRRPARVALAGAKPKCYRQGSPLLGVVVS